ncbi:MAG: hypothetical protein HYW37_01685 [Candidatus Colwellbacteria bacterium]|nr:hypothetical protein [Candidatus Colwellbacteria bacterium]
MEGAPKGPGDPERDLLPGAEGPAAGELPAAEVPDEAARTDEPAPEDGATPAAGPVAPKKGRRFPFFGRGTPEDKAAKDKEESDKKVRKEAEKAEKEARETADKAKRAEYEREFGNVSKKETSEEKAARKKAEKDKRETEKEAKRAEEKKRKDEKEAEKEAEKARKKAEKEKVKGAKVTLPRLTKEETGKLSDQEVMLLALRRYGTNWTNQVGDVSEFRRKLEEEAQEDKEGERNLKDTIKAVVGGLIDKLPGRGKERPSAAVEKEIEDKVEKGLRGRIFNTPVVRFFASAAVSSWHRKGELIAGAVAGFAVRSAVRVSLGTVGIPIAATAGAVGGAAAGLAKEVYKERRAYGSFVKEILGGGTEISQETFLQKSQELRAKIKEARERHKQVKESLLAKGLNFMGGKSSLEEELSDQLRYLNVAFKRQSEKGGKSLVDLVSEMIKLQGITAGEGGEGFRPLDARDDLIREIQESKQVDLTKLRNAILRGAVIGAIGGTVAGVWIEVSQANHIDIAGAIGSLAKEHGIDIDPGKGLGEFWAGLTRGGEGVQQPAGPSVPSQAVPSPGTSPSGIAQPVAPTGTEAPPTPRGIPGATEASSTPRPSPTGAPSPTPGVTPTPSPEATPTGTPGPTPRPEATHGPTPSTTEVPPKPGPTDAPPKPGATDAPPKPGATGAPPKPGDVAQPDKLTGIPTQTPEEIAAAAKKAAKEATDKAAQEAADAAAKKAALIAVSLADIEKLGLSVNLPSGSNVWNESSKLLENILHRDPTNAEILVVARTIAKESGVKVPSWGLTEGVDQHQLRTGFELKTGSEATKNVLKQIASGKIPEIPQVPPVPVAEEIPKVPDLPPELKALPETVHLPKGNNGLSSVAQYLEGALGEKPTQAELLRMTRAVVKESGIDFIDKTAGWGSTEATSQVILPADADLKFTPAMKKIIQELIETPSLTPKLSGLSENVPLPKGVNGLTTIARYFKEAFGRDPTLSEAIKATRAVAKASGIDFIDKTAGWGSTEATSQIILPKDTVLKFTPKVKGLIQRIFEASRK